MGCHPVAWCAMETPQRAPPPLPRPPPTLASPPSASLLTDTNNIKHKLQIHLQCRSVNCKDHNLISEEVRGAARAEIAVRKPPKRCGSITRLMNYMQCKRSLTKPAAVQQCLRHFFQRHFPKNIDDLAVIRRHNRFTNYVVHTRIL